MRRYLLTILAGLCTSFSASAQISLDAGWNLLGNNSTAAIDPAAMFGTPAVPVAGVTSQVQTVWVWDSKISNWQFFAPTLGASELAAYAQSKNYGVLASIPVGRGFWVNTRSALTVPASAPATTATTYTAAAMIGELVSYTVDPTNLTYSYTIAESQYGLTGKTGSGTLTKNADGSYTPSGIPNAKIAILPNGILYGAIRETFSGILKSVPIVGFSNPVSTLAQGQGIYNFVQYACIGVSCGSAFGTFKIDPSGTWSSCPSGNLSTGCTGTTRSGALNSIGNGKWLVMDSSNVNIGTAFAFSSGGQNVVVLDLKDKRASGYGVGLLVGASQQPIDLAGISGKWHAASSNGHSATFTANGANITYNDIDGVPSTQTISISANSPWAGFATTPSGGKGFLAGSGVYVYENSISGAYAELGIKIQ